MDNFKLALDAILILMGVWMVMSVRGLGGIVGTTLNYITWGALVTGFAHLIASLGGSYFESLGPGWGAASHRLIVLIGFGLLLMGFRNLKELG